MDKKLSFLQIGDLVNDAIDAFPFKVINNYNDVIENDKAAREFVLSKI